MGRGITGQAIAFRGHKGADYRPLWERGITGQAIALRGHKGADYRPLGGIKGQAIEPRRRQREWGIGSKGTLREGQTCGEGKGQSEGTNYVECHLPAGKVCYKSTLKA